MLDRCVFCGEELIGGICPNKEQHIKPMCLNCEYCKREDGKYYCINEDNKLDAIQKIKTSFDGGYVITNVELQPLPLKEPSRKCKRYYLNCDRIVNTLRNFVLSESITTEVIKSN
jgi:hypothetical protein